MDLPLTSLLVGPLMNPNKNQNKNKTLYKTGIPSTPAGSWATTSAVDTAVAYAREMVVVNRGHSSVAQQFSMAVTPTIISSGKVVNKGPSSAYESNPLQASGSLPGTSRTVNNKPAKITKPSKILYKQRRHAQRILKSSSAILEGESNAGHNSRIEWAKSILAKTKNSGASTSTQQSSLDESTPFPKNPNVQNTSTPNNPTVPLTKSFSDVLDDKNKFVVAVIDRSNIDGTISTDRWQMVKVKLSAVFLKVMREYPGPPPVTNDGGWHQGHVKLIICNDQRSYYLYRLAVSMLGEVWPGARLVVVDKEDIPCKPRARAWIPLEPSCIEDIHDMIKLSNPDLPCHEWRIAKLEEPKGLYRSAIIVIDRESVALLARTKGVIKYGFETITLRIYKKDEVDALCEPQKN